MERLFSLVFFTSVKIKNVECFGLITHKSVENRALVIIKNYRATIDLNTKADYIHLFVLIIMTSSPWTRRLMEMKRLIINISLYMFHLERFLKFEYIAIDTVGVSSCSICQSVISVCTFWKNILRTHKHVLTFHGSPDHCVLMLLMISQLMKPLLTETEHVPHGTLNTSLPLKGPSTPLSPRFASGCSQEMKAAIRQEASQSAGAASCKTRTSGRVCASLGWWLRGGLSQLEHPKHFNLKWRCNNNSRFPHHASFPF